MRMSEKSKVLIGINKLNQLNFEGNRVVCHFMLFGKSIPFPTHFLFTDFRSPSSLNELRSLTPESHVSYSASD